MRRVVEDEPERPTTIHRATDRDMETICLKCLEKEPARRYSSAATLADDLERWLRGEPIHARPTTTWERVVKWSRRKPAIAALTVAVIAASVAGVAGVLWQWRRADATAARERRERRTAQANLYAADMILTGHAIRQDDVAKATRHLDRHIPVGGEQDFRGWEWRYFRGLLRSDELFGLQMDQARVRAVSFLSNNRLVSTSGGTLRFWDLRERRLARSHNHGGTLDILKTSPDGTFIAAAHIESKQMIVWNAVTGEGIYSNHVALHSAPTGQQFDFVPGRRQMVLLQRQPGATEATIVLADLDQPAKPPMVLARSQHILGLACSPDGRHLAYRDRRHVVIRDFANGEGRTVPGSPGAPFEGDVRAVCFSGDGALLALATERMICLVDVATGQFLRSHTNHTAPVRHVLFSENARLLISMGEDQQIRFQHVDPWKAAAVYRIAHDEHIAVSPDGRLLATGGSDGRIKIWNALPEPAPDRWAFLNQPGTKRFAFDDRRFVTFQWQGATNVIQMWEVPSGRQLASFTVVGARVRDATVVWPGNRLALFRADSAIELWNPDGSVQSARFELGAGRIHPESIDAPILFSFDEGRQLLAVVGSGDNLIFTPDDQLRPLRRYTIDVPGKRMIESTSVQPDIRLSAGDCSRDGRHFALGGFGGEVVVIDDSNGFSARRLAGRHQDWVTDIGFSRDDRWMATTANDGSVILWETATWHQRATFRAHRTAAQSIAFHPTGTRIVVGTTDAISVWELDGLRELAAISGPRAGGVTRLHFVDQKTLVGWVGTFRSHPADETVVWHAPSFEQLAGLDDAVRSAKWK